MSAKSGLSLGSVSQQPVTSESGVEDASRRMRSAKSSGASVGMLNLSPLVVTATAVLMASKLDQGSSTFRISHMTTPNEKTETMRRVGRKKRE